MQKAKYIITILVFSLIIAGTSVWMFAKAPDQVSEWERRKLDQFPELTWETLMSGDFMADFESYLSDQFPMRNSYRRIKAKILFDVMLQKDNNGIYLADGHASKFDGEITQASIDGFCGKLMNIYNAYLKDTDCNVYYSVIPDKNYFLAEENGYPAFDYDYLFAEVDKGLSVMEKIDITDLLSIDDYYTTDTHWKQEAIVDVANRIRNQMGMSMVTDYTQKSAGDFYGVYYGQSALDLECDEIIYLENEEIAGSSVYNEETRRTTPVYDLAKLQAMDHYDIYLSGATPILKITNPMGEAGKKLVVFRDSFGSSLTPLLMSGYEEITVIDTRYIMPSYISRYVEFTDQDVLFIYSTMIIDSSDALR